MHKCIFTAQLYNSMFIFVGSVRKQPSVPTNQVKAPRRTKKQELAAQQAAEQIRKYGICMVPIRMAMFFSGNSEYSDPVL